jgi:E3 ubiquitin-protein ligase BAH
VRQSSSQTDSDVSRFYIYLEAAVFFSTREADSGRRNSVQAARQLNWFQSEVTRKKLVDAFKLPASRHALDRFVSINITLLLNLKYQELQQKAIGKITKSKLTYHSRRDMLSIF